MKTAKSPNRNWELDYSYDGFGNLSSHKRKNRGRKGKDFELKHNAATNRMVSHSVEYDANGNMVRLAGMELAFDVENRLVELRHNERGVEQYAYDVGNRRVWKKQPNGVEEFYLYGENSRPLAVYRLTEEENKLEFELVDYSVYFANRLIRSRDRAVVLNQQYSVEMEVGRNGNLKTSFLPFGEEESATEENRLKFGTYRRDATSGLDYAEQRYYSPEIGRFITPDPYVRSIKPNDPETWNRYAYCGNDPINCIDPHGTNCRSWAVGSPWEPCGRYNCPAYTEINDPLWIYYHPEYGICDGNYNQYPDPISYEPGMDESILQQLVDLYIQVMDMYSELYAQQVIAEQIAYFDSISSHGFNFNLARFLEILEERLGYMLILYGSV